MGLLDFAKDKFYSIFKNKNDFYLNYVNVGQKGAVWIETSKPYELYYCIPQLKSVIDMRANMFSNGVFKIEVDGKVVDIKDNELKKLLENPNAIQPQNEFLKEYELQRLIFGNQFQYKNVATSLRKYPSAIWNISANYITPYLTGKLFDQVDKLGIISYYEYKDEGGGIKKYDVNSILHSKITDINNPVVGRSPLTSLKFPLTNTKLAYEYRNVIMGEKGAIGILSNQSKDSMGAIPVSKEEREKIEKSYRSEYGVGAGQKRIHITSSNLSWSPMTYPTRDLLLFEEVDANMITLCDAFGLSINIFSSKQATYENFKQSMISAYQNVVMPSADEYTQALGKFLNLDFKLTLDYSHLAILQEDDGKRADVLQKQIAAILQMVDKRIINSSMAIELIQQISGLDFTNIKEQKEVLELINSVSPLVANNMIQQLTINEIRDIFGYVNTADGNQRPAAANAELQESAIVQQSQ